MAKKQETQQVQEKFKTMIGGQALIEGIMMRGPEKESIVVRTPDGEMVTKTEELKLPAKKHPILAWPLIRGVVNFCSSMACGVRALMYSAEFFPEEEGEPSKFDKWLEKHIGSEKMEQAVTYFSLFLGLLLAVALFVLLPTFISGLIPGLKGNYFLRNLTEGVLKIGLLLGYMYLVSQMKDMKRVLRYHGAEHKTIRCYEAKLPLTVENVRPMTRLHPRCGTSFLLVVVIISILVGSLIRADHTLVRIGLHLLLLPVVVSIAYEFNRLVGRYDNWLTRILTAPGMWLQKYFTTREPDDSMMECAIKALEEVIPTQEGADKW